MPRNGTSRSDPKPLGEWNTRLHPGPQHPGLIEAAPGRDGARSRPAALGRRCSGGAGPDDGPGVARYSGREQGAAARSRHRARRRRGTPWGSTTVTRQALMTLLAASTVAAAAEANDGAAERPPLPDGFVYLDQVIPDLVVDLRYATDDNFVGRPIDGYRHAHAILSTPAASALAAVQDRLLPFGLGLKLFDAYRPQRAVEHFVCWGKALDDQRTKPTYYPDVAKQDLFAEGYIASRSSHSRGSTVDVTIVSRDDAGAIRALDMGSRFDFFGPLSWPESTLASPQQRANRALLQNLMTASGFAPYAKEWWHFTLRDEPYPDTYFDFPN